MLNKIKNNKIDWTLFTALIILILGGAISFLSASLGKLAIDNNEFTIFIKNQFLFIFLIGPFVFLIGIFVNYKYYKKYSLYIFIILLVFSLTVFIPSLNFEHQGGVRWLSIFGFSIQPSEFLKFGSIIFMSYFGFIRKIAPKTFKWQLLPFLIFSILLGAILIKQKDFGTLFTILIPAFTIFIISGSKIKYSLIMIFIGLIGFISLILISPYKLDRVLTFLKPNRDPLGASYQPRQALIAIGSGELIGKGLGQSIQKFSNYLPEQATDSIFAIYSEEMGFVGGVFLLGLYLFIIIRSLNVAKNINDPYAKFLIIGIIATFSSQIFLNILSTLH